MNHRLITSNNSIRKTLEILQFTNVNETNIGTIHQKRYAIWSKLMIRWFMQNAINYKSNLFNSRKPNPLARNPTLHTGTQSILIWQMDYHKQHNTRCKDQVLLSTFYNNFKKTFTSQNIPLIKIKFVKRNRKRLYNCKF